MTKDWVGKIGFRYRVHIERLDPVLYQELRQYSTCNLADGAGRGYSMDPGIHPYGKTKYIIGPAITVELPPGDNLMLNKAMAIAHPGDILVIKTMGTQNYSVIGGLLMRRMYELGIGGVVVDGCLRDVEDLEALDFPVFARGVQPVGSKKNGPGQVNFPIACGGVVVMPGDTVIADVNGVIVLPNEDVPDVLAVAKAKVAKEKIALEKIKAGELLPKDVDEILAKKLG